MSNPASSEVASTVLPVTGSGPFSLIVALIGLIAVAAGSVMRRIARS